MDAVRIAVDPTGKPWIVTKENVIFRRVGDGWQQLPGRFSDVAIGFSGGVWALGPAEGRETGGLPIFSWNGAAWQKVRGFAVRIAVDAKGAPWIITDTHSALRLPEGTSSWQQLPGRVNEIALGPEGSAWALGPPEGLASGGYPILRWKGTDWEKFPGAATRIAVDSTGAPWVINDRHQAYRLADGFCWQEAPGMVTEIAAGADGSVCAIGRAKDHMAPPIVRWDGRRWSSVEDHSAAAASATPTTGVPQLPAPARGGPQVLYCRNGTDWRKLAGRVREITIEPDGSASVRFEDGERMPLTEGGELFIPDERTKGLKIQFNVKKKPRPDKIQEPKREDRPA
jgi:hypothetical protein